MELASSFETGRVTISLDTELGWGRIATGGFDEVAEKLDGGKRAIMNLLELFDRYTVPVTWALVGQLFREDPASEASIAHYTNQVTSDEIPWSRDWWRAPDEITAILDSPMEHEIAAHSATHIPYESLSRSEARADLERFAEWTVPMLDEAVTTWVFPQNQIAHLHPLVDAGYTCYRGTPPFLGVDPSPTAFLPRRTFGLIDIPASVAFRSYAGRSSLLSAIPTSLIVTAMKIGVEHAVHRGRVCHIVLHPKDFARSGASLLAPLESFLEYVVAKREAGCLKIQTMGDLASESRILTSSRG